MLITKFSPNIKSNQIFITWSNCAEAWVCLTPGFSQFATSMSSSKNNIFLHRPSQSTIRISSIKKKSLWVLQTKCLTYSHCFLPFLYILDIVFVPWILFHFFLPVARQPLVGQGLLIIEASRSHSDTPHSIGLLWTSDQPNAENFTWQHTQHSQETDRHATGGIRTPNPSKLATAHPHLRRRGYWDRPMPLIFLIKHFLFGQFVKYFTCISPNVLTAEIISSTE
jgi:hypothetical protein